MTAPGALSAPSAKDLEEAPGPAPVGFPAAGQRAVEVAADLRRGRAPERARSQLGLPARLTLRAATSRGDDGAPALQAATAAQLTHDALEWHAAAAAGSQPVGFGTLAGDYCLAQAAATLTHYRDPALEAAFADGLTAAGADLAVSGNASLASRRLLPAAGLSGARTAGLSGSDQARWWAAGRRLERSAAALGESRAPVALPQGLLARSADPLERRLGQILALDPGFVAAPMESLLSAGGKRIRARLVLLAGEIGGRYRPDQLFQGAAAMEILHAATLCHDDLVDGATSRRGLPTVASLGGALAALGVGDYYLGRASGLIARLADPRISRYFASALVGIADGQLQELGRRSTWSGRMAPYVRVAQLKTGSLLAASAATGARVGGASPTQVRAVAEFARKLGLAFQGVDDCLDFSDPQRTGKPAGTDLAQGICGLPLLCALRGPRRSSLMAQLRRLESAEGADAGRLRDQILDLVRDSGALASARGTADAWSSQAVAGLAPLPAGVRQRLQVFADQLTLRDS